ncbi:hypothetical protein T440DRAFT_217744 [Plenodomus tracheiphilus IPT5]|uniref:Uncharacterized protein n=1 Tax=Plenodomus tracheiphilus IPT5 TaxID=1408161 RepID=A0A6A7AXV1_9PLEO|nr:hypothetical protein T440DRAFT_217744 [Plenodomus tracheiphilus IPT5]
MFTNYTASYLFILHNIPWQVHSIQIPNLAQTQNTTQPTNAHLSQMQYTHAYTSAARLTTPHTWLIVRDPQDPGKSNSVGIKAEESLSLDLSSVTQQEKKTTATPPNPTPPHAPPPKPKHREPRYDSNTGVGSRFHEGSGGGTDYYNQHSARLGLRTS